MEKRKMVLYLAIVVSLLSLLTLEVGAVDASASVNRIFIKQDEGYFGKLRVDFVDNYGMYVEVLQLDDYYRQISSGIEIKAYNHSQRQLWVLCGLEEYSLVGNRNAFFRTGLRADLSVSFGDVSVSTDLMFDDIAGVFLRYQLELNTPKGWLQSNIGFGNLLGSRDGYAFWVGFNL